MSQLKKSVCLRLVAAACLAAAAPAFADRTWIGGNVDWVDGAGAANWSPSGEPGPTDGVTFNTANTVNLGSNNSINFLALSNGIDLLTNDHNLTVDGLLSLTGASTNLIIGGTASTLFADSVTINTGSIVELTGGTLNMTEETGNGLFTLNSGGTFVGNGKLFFGDGVTAGTVLMLNEGTLSARSTSPFLFGAPPVGTLTLQATANARIDLDGNSGFGIVNVFRNQTLVMAATINDPFSGSMNLFQQSTFNVAGTWSIDSGTIDINSGSIPGLLGAPAGIATITGGTFTQSGGNINVNDTDGTLQFSAPFLMNAGSLTNKGLVIFNANATIGAAAHFTMPEDQSSITLSPGVAVTVNQPDFNVDGNGFTTNVLTINSAASLTLNLGAGGDTELENSTFLNGGTLNVTTASSSWSMFDEHLSVGANTGTSAISGDALSNIQTTSITVGTNATLNINTVSTWGAGTNVTTNAGAITRFNNATTFNATGTFSGAGTLLFAASLTNAAANTIDMPAGAVDLDGGPGDIVGATITLDQNLVINVATMSSFGNANFILTNILTLNNFASLTVNLTNPNASWTLNSNAIINVNAVGGMLGGGGIQGSDFNMAGTANISGNSIWTARTTISGTVNIAAASSFNLRGGTLANPNRLQGGSITASGTTGILQSLTNTALAGFGTISAPIDFANNTEIRADDGTLTLSGPITHVGILGTFDTDGVLNVTNPWNTNVTNQVQLKGGTLTGSSITNAGTGGINGFGRISASVNNNSFIRQNGGATTLVVVGGDFDGSAENGVLTSIAGTLELQSVGGFGFNSTINASSGGTLFANGFDLFLDTTSNLNLTNGTYKSNSVTTFQGAIHVNAGADSTLDTGANLMSINATTVATLTGNLVLNSSNIALHLGAAFSGNGSLIILNGSNLFPDAGATANVLVDNRGIISPASATIGIFNIKDFQQSATGGLNIQLGGTGLNQYDRLALTGIAQLNGAVNLSLTGGFVPTLGNSFIVLSAPGGIVNTFASINSPGPIALAAGLSLNFVLTPTYNANNVTLNVTRAFYEVQSGAFPQNLTGSGYELVKTTAATATVSGNSSITGLTTVSAGILIVNGNNSLASGGLDIQGTAVTRFGPGLGLAIKTPNVTLAHTGSGTSAIYTATLNITDDKLIVQSTGGADKTNKLIALNEAILSGAGGPNANTWNGNGITSSTIGTQGSSYGVGLFDNGAPGMHLSSFGGTPVNTNSLLIAISHVGDANRDGTVNVVDLGIVANNFQQPRNNWAQGDLNRDGVVNVVDLGIVANNFQQTSIFPLQPNSPFTIDHLPFTIDSPASPVPEPTSLVLLATLAPLLLTRRRK